MSAATDTKFKFEGTKIKHENYKIKLTYKNNYVHQISDNV